MKNDGIFWIDVLLYKYFYICSVPILYCIEYEKHSYVREHKI